MEKILLGILAIIIIGAAVWNLGVLGKIIVIGIVSLIIGFIAYTLYESYRKKQKISEEQFWSVKSPTIFRHTPGSKTSKISKTLNEKFAVIDVETTGLNPYSDEIIQLSIVLFENGIPIHSKTVNEYFNPTVKIDKKASAVNGLKKSKLLRCPKLESRKYDIRKKLVDLTNDGYIFVAHNAKFDFSFIQSAFGTFGTEFTMEMVDTLYLAQQNIHNVSNYKLITLCKELNLPVTPTHNSKDDCLACGYLLLHIINNP